MKKMQWVATLVIALFSIANLFAQKDKDERLQVKYGKLTDEEIKMTVYPKDSSAAAVVLFDKGYCSYGKGVYTRHIRYKIFKKEAYEYANLIFGYPKGVIVKEIKGICYNFENGKMTETQLRKENIFEEKISKNVFIKKIVMPSVKEGSIIEFSYQLDKAIHTEWTFQNDIPTIWSEFELSIPTFYAFSQVGQGSTPYFVNKKEVIQETELGAITVSRPAHGNYSAAHGMSGSSTRNENYNYSANKCLWIQKDVPAIKSEKYITSTTDFKTRLSFFIKEILPYAGFGTPTIFVKSWEETIKELMKDDEFGSIIEKKSAYQDEMKNITKPSMSQRQTVTAIYDYLGKNFNVRESEYEDGSVFLSDYLKEIKDKRKGTATDINLLLLNMLKAAGINANPVLISTRKHGKIGTPLPVLSRFNRVIAKVNIDKDSFFMDASNYPHPIDLLPFEDLVSGGYELISKDDYQIVVPTNKIPNRQFVQADLSLNTEGVLSGKIMQNKSGYEALNARKRINETDEKKYIDNEFKDLLTSGKLESQQLDKAKEFGEPNLIGNFTISTKDYVEKNGDKIYVNPMLSFGDKQSPFANPERKYEIDYGTPKDDLFNLTLTLPEGYKIEEMPKMARLQMPDGAMKFDYLIETVGNKITLKTKLNRKRTVFPVDEYSALRDFYGKVIAKMGEQIVLSKIAK